MAQEELSRKVELAWLMAFYGGMLTEKQRLALRLHCEEDMSLGEIAKETGVSRQGVHEMLARAARNLFEMEEKLGMAKRFSRMDDGLEKCRQLMQEKRYDEAKQVLGNLIRLDREENDGL